MLNAQYLIALIPITRTLFINFVEQIVFRNKMASSKKKRVDEEEMEDEEIDEENEDVSDDDGDDESDDGVEEMDQVLAT